MKKPVHIQGLKSQKGFGIGAIIGIVALLAVLGAVIASSLGGGSANTATEQDKLNASSILMQSGSIKDASDLLIAKYRDATYDDINLDSTWDEATSAYGIYNATYGTLEFLVPPKAAFTTSATVFKWVKVDSTASTVDFDGNTTNDSYIRLTGLTDNVCKAINGSLGLGDTTAPTTTDRTAYCSNNGTDNVYYKALQVK